MLKDLKKSRKNYIDLEGLTNYYSLKILIADELLKF